MAKDSKASKAEAAPKKDAAAKVDTPAAKDAPAEAAKDAPKDKSKSEGGETAAPANYSRGEGQKPVTAAYRENWNAIFRNKKAKKRKR